MSLKSYLAQESAVTLTKDQRWSHIDDLISRAVTSQRGWKQLEGRINNFNIKTGSFLGMKIHQGQLQNTQNSPNEELKKLLKNKNKMSIEAEINDLLKRINNWGIRGYEIIVELRQTATGQVLIYHIQDKDHSVSYALDQKQFLQLLSSNTAGLNYAKWETIEKAVKEGTPKLDLFKLNVGATEKKLKDFKAPSINLKKDILYRYLLGESEIAGPTLLKKNTFDKEEDSYYVYHARIAELHSQLLAFFEWQYNRTGGVAEPKSKRKDDSGFFFTNARRRAVDTFIGRYKKEGLHKDTDTFYETGDATASATVLIENKVGNAVVSISTIRNAINKIAALKGLSREQIAQSFINMFTKSSEANTLTYLIQGAAEEKAISEINKLILK